MPVRRLSNWLVPTFGGAIGCAWLATTLLGIVGPTDPLLGNRFWNWVASMLVTTPLAALLGGMLCLTDVMLVKWREIPLGRRAWWMSAIAPLGVGLAYTVHRPGQHGSAAMFILAVVIPMAAVSLATRWLLGRRMP
jgi:hypothetical protein